MKTFFTLFTLSVLSITAFSQGVTIGTNNPPDPSAVLDLQSSSSGFLLPRLTTTQRNAIANPTEGLQIYNTTIHCVELYFQSIGWKAVQCDCNQPPAQPGQISGQAAVCPNGQGIMYTIAPVQGAVSYQWTVPSGATIASGQGNDSIVVNFGNQNGAITVTAINSCGLSQPQAVNISIVQATAQFVSVPNPISVNANTVFNPSYTVPGTQYSWTFQNGNPATSTAQNPTVVWNNVGSTTVTLSITTSQGCTASFSDVISIVTCPPPGGSSQTFTYTGGVQTWTVPACANQVTIEVWGAEGGYGYVSGLIGPGGRGGYATGVKTVTPGSTLYIYVGGRGADGGVGVGGAGGWNGGGLGGSYSTLYGGGGGGGGTDVRYGGTALTDRIIVGGGGGGGSYYAAASGGGGGYPNGADGLSTSGGTVTAKSGRGGTQSTGGAGGTDTQAGSLVGSPGTFGLGGNSGVGSCSGGGGGGWYGGGGGSGCNGGGGGGGSSYYAGMTGSTNSQNAIRQGNGQVILTW